MTLYRLEPSRVYAVLRDGNEVGVSRGCEPEVAVCLGWLLDNDVFSAGYDPARHRGFLTTASASLDWARSDFSFSYRGVEHDFREPGAVDPLTALNADLLTAAIDLIHHVNRLDQTWHNAQQKERA